jgi:hypothetical protein
VAVRARSRMPAVAPTCMSRVTRMLACPAIQDTSVASRRQEDRAAVQNTCRRPGPGPGPGPGVVAAGVAPPCVQVGRCQGAAVEVGGPPVPAAGGGEHQPEGVGAGVLLGPGLLGAGRDLPGQRVALRSADRVDGAAALTAPGGLQEQFPADLDDLAVHGDDTGSGRDLVQGESEQLPWRGDAHRRAGRGPAGGLPVHLPQPGLARYPAATRMSWQATAPMTGAANRAHSRRWVSACRRDHGLPAGSAGTQILARRVRG